MQSHQQPDLNAPVTQSGPARAFQEQVLCLLDQVRSVSDRLVLDGHPLARDLFRLEGDLRDAVIGLEICYSPVKELPGTCAFSDIAMRRVVTLANALRELVQPAVFIASCPGINAGVNT